jgi:hypothetical protein
MSKEIITRAAPHPLVPGCNNSTFLVVADYYYYALALVQTRCVSLENKVHIMQVSEKSIDSSIQTIDSIS